MPRPIRTLIIEDETSAISRLRKELDQLSEVEFDVLGTLESVSESVTWLKENENPDLIFMDIQLTDGLSLEIFKQIEVPVPVIFTTAFDEYAVQAFKFNSIDYLLKPIDPKELKAAIDSYLSLAGKQDQSGYFNQLLHLAQSFKPSTYRSSFLVSYRQKMLLIDIQDVAYLYIKERGVFLKKKDGLEYVIEFFLDDLEKQLDPAQFYRANRQFLVARSSIQEIEPYFNGRLIIMMKPEAHIPVTISKEKATHFKRWADY
ncbi:MAG: LytTR family DNA-binding domain-containing protein [Bacteroidota bacterium]